MKEFRDTHAPGVFDELYYAILNDEKETPKKRKELQISRVFS